MKEERLDIYTEDMMWIGTASRTIAHRAGFWHKTFHCWIVSRRRDQLVLLFQQRHADKQPFPNMLDKSAAGHYLQGENEREGLRELEEELGIKAAWEDLLPCGMVAQTYTDETIKDREFCLIYLLFLNLPLEQYVLQENEVAEIYQIALQDYQQLLERKVTCIEGHSASRQAKFRLDDFTPQSSAYQKVLFTSIMKHAADQGL